MKIAIAIRTCDSVLNYWNSKRIVDCSKPELILTCLNSLLKSIQYDLNHTSDEIVLSIHDGSSSDATKQKIIDLCSRYNLIPEFYECTLLGNFRSQYTWCKNQTCDYLYCLEDDYLHTCFAIKDMRDIVEKLNRFLPGDYAVHPFNSPHRYASPDMLYPSFILKGDNQYWRSSFHSTHTFFISKKSFTEYDFVMKKQAFDFPHCTEDQSINRVWREQHVRLVTPLQSLAFHLADETQEDSLSNWEMLWRQNCETWEDSCLHHS